MVVKGENVLRMSVKSVDEMRARPGLNGVPLLAPFANRLDQQAFYANGKKYNFDMELGNVRGAIPIHGYLSGASEWKVVEAKADGAGAWVTSKLDFYRNPQYMKQFPFAHTLTMTYRLADGVLEVRTRIDNLSVEPMPVSIGYHPYFQLTDSNRSDWTLNVGAKTHWLLNATKTPTGETEPAATFFGGDQHAVPMSRFATREIDDIFTDLERDAQGRATVSFSGPKQSVAVIFGPKYKTALIYSTPRPAAAPPRRRSARGRAPGRAAAGQHRTRRAPERQERCGAAGAWVRRHRADGRDHQCDEPRPDGRLQRPAKRRPRRLLAGELLDQAQRFLGLNRRRSPTGSAGSGHERAHRRAALRRAPLP